MAARSGLTVFIRDGHWHCSGTVRARDKRKRVRKSLGLDQARPKREAEDAARQEENRTVEVLLYGKEAAATWSHAAARYLTDRRDGKPDDWGDNETPLVRKLTQSLAHTRLSEITPTMLQGVLNKHWGDTSVENRRRVCSTIGGVLSAAVRHGLIKARPHIPRPRGGKKSAKVNKWLHADEIRLLIDCMPEQVRLPVKVMFLQGRRPSEILYREWEDLNMRPGRERLDLGETKTGKQETIALDAEVARDLRALATARRRDGEALEGPIFLNAHGEPWHNPKSAYGLPINKPFRQGRERAADALLEMARDAGTDVDRREFLIDRADVMRQVTAYWGRHNFVSHHVAGQTPDQAIAEMVGWTSNAMLSRYAHLSDGHLRDRMSKVRLIDDGETGS